MNERSAMKRVVLIGVLALCALARPANAFAQGDFLDWLEQFSGPGPFHGVTIGTRVVCVRDNAGTLEHGLCFNDTDPNIKTVMNVEFGFATSGSQARFPDTPNDVGVVHASRLNVTYMYRVSPMLDVGIGIGALTFSGDSFENQVHPILTPFAVTFTPLGMLHGPKSVKWGRVLRVKFADRYVFSDIRAVDFHSASSYLKHGEFNPGFGIGVDFWSFFAR